MEVDFDFGIDLATRSDITEGFDRLLRGLSNPYSEKFMAAFSGIVGTDGAAGVATRVGFRVFDVPDGKTFYLTKFIAWDDAHNPSTGGVYTNAAAWCGIFHGIGSPVSLAEFWPKPEAANGQVLPYTYEYGKESAPEFRQNDNVYFKGEGLETGHNITLMIFGILEDLAVREGHTSENAPNPVRRGRPLRKRDRTP